MQLHTGSRANVVSPNAVAPIKWAPAARRFATIRDPAGSFSRHNCVVQFSKELRERVADGTITVSYRLWSRPQVKVGGTYRCGPAAFEVDEIELVPFASITDDDLADGRA